MRSRPSQSWGTILCSIFPFTVRGHMRSKYWAIECKFLIIEIYIFFFKYKWKIIFSYFEFLFRKCLFPNYDKRHSQPCYIQLTILSSNCQCTCRSKFFDLELHAFSKCFVTHCNYLISFMKIIMVWIPHSHCCKFPLSLL